MTRLWLVGLVVVSGCEGNLEGRREPSQAPAVTASPRLDCNGVHPASTVLHRLTTEQYAHAIRDVFEGAVTPAGSFPTRFGVSATGFTTEEPLNAVGEQGATQLLRAAETVAVDVSQALEVVLPCATGGDDTACLERYLDTTARRAFRRSLTAGERDALRLAYADMRAAGGDFADGIAQVTSVLLQSPQFLYVVEDAAGEARALSDVELASRLSFLLWDSVPDDALLSLAEAGQLHEPATLRAEAQRLLTSPKADAAMVRWFREWTQTRSLLSSDKDPTRFPFFDQAYADALDESFDRFVLDQLHHGGTLTSLLTSTDAWVNDALAPSWNVAAPPAGTWAKVQVDGSRYAGLLTHPLVLSVGAHPTESSFIFRGRTVQKRLLCTPMGAPPANASTLFSAIPLPEHPTAREVSDGINGASGCAGCHRLLNPPGLALEHFDATGRWRDRDASGHEILTGGTLEGVAAPFAFEDPVQLAARLAQTPEASSCLSTQLFRFTFSRQETQADGCALQAMREAIDASHGDLSQALLAMVTTDAFTWRTDP